MAIAASRPVVGVASTTNASSYAMTAFTPTANSLLVLFVFTTGTVAAAPTVSGGSLTWVLKSSAFIGGNGYYIFYAKVATPASTTITFNCTGDAATGCVLSVCQFTGYDSDSADPIRQVKMPTAATTSTNANGTFPSALLTTSGYMIGWAGALAANSSTAPSGWTEADDLAYSTPAQNASTAYRAGGLTSSGPFAFTNASTAWIWMGVEVAIRTLSMTITAGSYSLTGNNVGIALNRQMGITTGSYAVTGNQVNLMKVRQMVITAGSYSVTGQPVNVRLNRAMGIVTGSYNITGQGVGMNRGRTMNVSSGAYNVVGNQVGIVRNRVMSVGTGGYVLTGNSVSILRSRIMQILPGGYVVEGNSVSILRSRLMNIQPGEYLYQGNSVNMALDTNDVVYDLNFSTGGYLLIMGTSGMTISRVMRVQAGVYVVTGNSVNLTIQEGAAVLSVLSTITPVLRCNSYIFPTLECDSIISETLNL